MPPLATLLLPCTPGQNTGIALFVLYIVQVIVGMGIHQFKQRGVVHRPPQNYFHAVLGEPINQLFLSIRHSLTRS